MRPYFWSDFSTFARMTRGEGRMAARITVPCPGPWLLYNRLGRKMSNLQFWDLRERFNNNDDAKWLQKWRAFWVGSQNSSFSSLDFIANTLLSIPFPKAGLSSKQQYTHTSCSASTFFFFSSKSSTSLLLLRWNSFNTRLSSHKIQGEPWKSMDF